MEIPNIYYNKNYKKLLVLPLLLVLVSLFLIPSIPLGIDFRGGTLFVVFVDEGTDLEKSKIDLQERLAVISPDVSIRQFENPGGKGFEIEMQGNTEIDKAQEDLTSIKRVETALISTQSSLQTAINNGENERIESLTATAQKFENDLLEKTNSFLERIGSKERASTALGSAGLAEAEFVETKSVYRENVLSAIEDTVPITTYSSREIGASLSRFFLARTTEIILLSFIASALVIVFVFRSLVPSVAVLFGAFADLVITLGIMGVLQIPLSLPTVAALLMLVGFSLDTDMLLTIRALKRTEETVTDRVFDSMKTAFLMNFTTVIAFAVLLIVASTLQIRTYEQIAMVAVIGGIVDFIATWTGNAVMVLWFAEVKK